jgi:hypothetical protein
MGLPARPAPGAATIGFCLGYGHFWTKSKVIRPAKIFWEAHNFVPGWNFDKRYLTVKAWELGDADRGIARVNRATRARAIGTYLLGQFISDHL